MGDAVNIKADYKIYGHNLYPAVIIRIGGFWSEEIGTYGIFSLQKSSTPKNIGDSVLYERNTEFDNHFHDFDEYWIIFDGKGRAVSEGRFFEVTAGDCIATQKGDHHDFAEVHVDNPGCVF